MMKATQVDETSAQGRVAGIARPGKRTKHLVKKLGRGDIAIIDHADIDRVSAEDLVACGVRAVVNCARSSTGTYPNMGPQILVEGGIQLIDAPDAPLFDVFSDGDAISLEGGNIYRGNELVAQGNVLELETVRRDTQLRREQIGLALERFAENTARYMRQESTLLTEKLPLPKFTTSFRDKPVLVVVRGVDHRKDLRALRPYIRDTRPILVGVDGGADAIREAGFRPDMIVGDMDSATQSTLGCGAELVVHAYPDGRAPGKDLLDKLGLDYKVVPAPGTSQDVAMLIAAELGAKLIVSVGSHFNLVEFMDKNRKGMASTFLTRLRIGEILVDAKGVSRLYRPGPGYFPLLLLVIAGFVALGTAVLTAPGIKDIFDLLLLKLEVLLGV